MAIFRSYVGLPEGIWIALYTPNWQTLQKTTTKTAVPAIALAFASSRLRTTSRWFCWHARRLSAAHGMKMGDIQAPTVLAKVKPQFDGEMPQFLDNHILVSLSIYICIYIIFFIISPLQTTAMVGFVARGMGFSKAHVSLMKKSCFAMVGQIML